MKNILVPVDFSDSTITTCKYAMKLIGNEKGKLFLFHIYPNQLIVADSSFPSGIDSDTFIGAEYINELRHQADLNMKELVKKVNKLIPEGKKGDITIENMVTGGEPEFEINQVCRDLQPDLIVMGTRGEGKKGFLEGSMAEKLMTATKVPLVAVPESFKDVKMHKIMYAMNFNEHDINSIETLINLYNQIEKEVYIVHIGLNEGGEDEKEMMESFKQTLLNTYPDIKFSFHILTGSDKSDALHNAVDEFQIDLIAFIAHKTNFFQNLFSKNIHKKDFFKLDLPMLALHEK
jgi:nucleotide-binding universal stress UspA family protein